VENFGGNLGKVEVPVNVVEIFEVVTSLQKFVVGAIINHRDALQSYFSSCVLHNSTV